VIFLQLNCLSHLSVTPTATAERPSLAHAPDAHQVFLGLEVPKDRPPSDTERRDDLIDRRVGEAPRQEQLHTGTRQLDHLYLGARTLFRSNCDDRCTAIR